MSLEADKILRLNGLVLNSWASHASVELRFVFLRQNNVETKCLHRDLPQLSNVLNYTIYQI